MHVHCIVFIRIIHVATLLQKHVHEWLIIVVDSLAHHYTSFTGRVDYN